MPWGTPDGRVAEEAGIQGQPETCPEVHANNGDPGYLSASQDQHAGTGSQNLSLFVEWYGDNEAESGMGDRHQLYPHGTGVPVPGSYHGLVQPVCTLLALVKHPGRQLLC